MTLTWLLAGSATVYLIGWVLAIPGALHRVMLTEVCSRCNETRRQAKGEYSDHLDRKYSHRFDWKWTPRGAVRERNGGDVAQALIRATAWPIRLHLWTVRFLAVRFGQLVKRTVTRAVSLTGPELERRIKEQQETIKRLQAEIDKDARSSRS